MDGFARVQSRYVSAGTGTWTKWSDTLVHEGSPVYQLLQGWPNGVLERNSDVTKTIEQGAMRHQWRLKPDAS